MTTFLNDSPMTLENGIEGKPWQVETGNPKNFHQAISDPVAIEPVSIWAQLFLPEKVAVPPLVFVVPGSMGVADSHIYKARLLTDAGIAACLLDPFGNRGVASTVANQAQFSFAASAWDVLCAVEQVSEQGLIDPDRIGAQGHSRGGSAVMTAASMAKFTAFERRMAGVYGAYPWSGMQFLNPSVANTRVRAIVGDQDEWCLPQQIQGHIQAIRLTGGDATCRIVAGAHHSFDRFSQVELVADASVSPGAPTIYIEDAGASIHPVTGEADPDADDRSMMMVGIEAGYGRRGARIGSHSNDADIFHQDMMAFWQSCL